MKHHPYKTNLILRLMKSETLSGEADSAVLGTSLHAYNHTDLEDSLSRGTSAKSKTSKLLIQQSSYVLLLLVEKSSR